MHSLFSKALIISLDFFEIFFMPLQTTSLQIKLVKQIQSLQIYPYKLHMAYLNKYLSAYDSSFTLISWFCENAWHFQNFKVLIIT